ncbi:uncharacterized protein LOC113788494 [Dermatophagoides pteronyssinus]|uniref:uncharacterized protein LOC113788494 n=1 Tax=Dermatophagoides pteronyssinus TaxID=6956 RepID=UPI003F66EA8B
MLSSKFCRLRSTTTTTIIKNSTINRRQWQQQWQHQRYLATQSSKYDLFKRNTNEEENLPTFLIFPEIPIDTVETNEFLTIPTTGQIPFDRLNVEKCVRASGKLSLEFEHFIDEYSNTLKQEFEDGDISNAKLDEFIVEMEKHLMPLQYNLNLLSAFKILRPNEFEFKLFDDFFLRRLSKSRLRFQNRNIYCFMCEMKTRLDSSSHGKKTPKQPETDGKMNKMDEDRKFLQQQKLQLIERYIREAKLFGLSLKHQDQLNSYNLINEKLNKEQQNFVQTAMQANGIFQSNIMSPQFLDCLPDHVITQLNHHDIDAVFNSFMRYCPDQTLRKDFWLAYNARAAPYLGSKLNNFLPIEKIRELRQQKAKQFGYENFAKFSLDLRSGSGCQTMAGNVDNVLAFMNGLGNQSDLKFEKNLKEIKDFAQEFRPEGRRAKQSPSTFMPSNIIVEKLQLWDLKYFERLFLRENYQIDSADVRAYFQLDRVVAGMFEFAERLFGIKIVEIKNDDDNQQKWGRNVRHYKIFDDNQRSSAEYGSFYFDPFQPRSRIFMPIARSDSMNTKPVVFFLMNFTHGSGTVFDQFEKQKLQATGKELLNFSQVVQLFGKFGYVLQHLLTKVDYSELGGLSNIEIDTFNMISHFMKLWPLNSYRVIADCSRHFKTGEPISEEFFERIRKSYYHFVSFPLKYELYLMALDMNLHTTNDHSTNVLRRTWSEWMQPFDFIDENGHTCSWIDLFKGDGQEGIYYSDKWSEVIATDLFDAFRERDNNLNHHQNEAIRQMGERFKDIFMAQSGVIETNELFRRFLGRDPTLNGYLNINGFVSS